MGPSLEAALSLISFLIALFDQVLTSSGCTAKSRSAARVAILAGTSAASGFARKVELSRED